MNRNIRPENVEFVVKASEDLILPGKERCIIRVPANNIYSCLMQKTQRFSSLFRHYSRHHGLPRNALEFSFTDRLDPEDSPESVYLQKNDVILVRHRTPSWNVRVPVLNDEEYIASMKALYRNIEDSDIVIKAGPEETVLHAHRLILSARCEYFRAMLRPGAMKESKVGIIRIAEHSAFIVAKMLEFIYTNRIENLKELDCTQLIELLTLAEQYLLTSLKTLCEVAGRELVNIENFGKLLCAAEKHNAVHLKELCVEFFVQYRYEILDHTAFKEEIETCPSIAIELLGILSRNIQRSLQVPFTLDDSLPSNESTKRRRLYMPSEEEDTPNVWFLPD